MMVTVIWPLIATFIWASDTIFKSFLDDEANVLEHLHLGNYMKETDELLRQSVRFGYAQAIEAIVMRRDFNPMLDEGAYLQIAVINGRDDIVEMVLEHDHRLAQKVLLWASRCGNVELVGHVLGPPYAVDPSVDDNAALRSAALGGHHLVVERLLKNARVDPNCNEGICLLSACNQGDTLVAIALLDDPRTKTSINGSIPFRLAARNGHTKIVRRLLKRRDVNPAAAHNEALKQATKRGHLDIVKMLLSDNRVQPGWECFYKAAVEGKADIVEAYLEDRRVDPSGVLSRALVDSCALGHTRIAELLLKDGRADPRDLLGRALHKSVKNGHNEIVQLLLKDGRVDPGLWGQSAFGTACLNGHREVAEALLEDHRVDPSKNCAYLLKVAAQFGEVEIADLLLEHERVEITPDEIGVAFNTALDAGHGRVIALLAKRMQPRKLLLGDDSAPATTTSIFSGTTLNLKSAKFLFRSVLCLGIYLGLLAILIDTIDKMPLFL